MLGVNALTPRSPSLPSVRPNANQYIRIINNQAGPVLKSRGTAKIVWVMVTVNTPGLISRLCFV